MQPSQIGLLLPFELREGCSRIQQPRLDHRKRKFSINNQKPIEFLPLASSASRFSVFFSLHFRSCSSRFRVLVFCIWRLFSISLR
ncbi:unnamed protein product [Citrullus colocynthis]|uniref:Uncharacterized protein n=1 Tax=Citrullus colocynthis TaxID=252529 RepID=A0ABP0YD00_9ROSI